MSPYSTVRDGNVRYDGGGKESDGKRSNDLHDDGGVEK
jgi:hypothetical protein